MILLSFLGTLFFNSGHPRFLRTYDSLAPLRRLDTKRDPRARLPYLALLAASVRQHLPSGDGSDVPGVHALQLRHGARRTDRRYQGKMSAVLFFLAVCASGWFSFFVTNPQAKKANVRFVLFVFRLCTKCVYYSERMRIFLISTAPKI